MNSKVAGFCAMVLRRMISPSGQLNVSSEFMMVVGGRGPGFRFGSVVRTVRAILRGARHGPGMFNFSRKRNVSIRFADPMMPRPGQFPPRSR